MFIHLSLSIHIYIYIYIYVHTYIHTYMHTYIHTYIHIHIIGSYRICLHWLSGAPVGVGGVPTSSVQASTKETQQTNKQETHKQ